MCTWWKSSTKEGDRVLELWLNTIRGYISIFCTCFNRGMKWDFYLYSRLCHYVNIIGLLALKDSTLNPVFKLCIDCMTSNEMERTYAQGVCRGK